MFHSIKTNLTSQERRAIQDLSKVLMVAFIKRALNIRSLQLAFRKGKYSNSERREDRDVISPFGWREMDE
jgi:hypothetical protein